MTPHPLTDWEPESALQGALHRIDRLAWSLGGIFLFLCNLCLLVMLAMTAATILMRPFDLSFYWIWPWTMVLFIWLSFFGFFALFVRLKDVRIDFLANLMGRPGMAFTRILSDLAAICVAGTLVWLMPAVLETSSGWVDGAIFPDGEELPRQALSIPLFISSALIVLAALLDLAKAAAGIPENVSTHHPEI